MKIPRRYLEFAEFDARLYARARYFSAISRFIANWMAEFKARRYYVATTRREVDAILIPQS